MTSVGLIIIGGLLLSAFFSGSETGLYRVARVRLALDSIAGDPISKGLLWLVNNPSLFVATSLIGNNLANYLVSYGVVLGTQIMMGGPNAPAEIIAPIIAAPFVFVYAELLPKNLYYLAPNRLLRVGGPLFLLCSVLFAPISATLWLLGRLLQRIIGESPELVRMQLARHELRKLMDEGHEIGILQPVQRQMSQAVFDYGGDPVTRYCTPPSRMSSVSIRDPLSWLRRLARRQHAPELLVWDEHRKIAGYVRAVDLYFRDEEWQQMIRPLTEIPSTASHVAALMTLHKDEAALAQVVDAQGKTVGIASLRRLIEPLYRGQ